MRQLITILIGMFLFSCSQNDNAEKGKLKYIGDFSNYKEVDTTNTTSIEKYQIDLDFDKQLDTIVLENLKDLIGDPQIFTIVKIKLASGRNFILNDVAGYLVDTTAKKNFSNRINSNKIYIPELNNKENYLIIWDYKYPSCDAYVSVFKIENNDVSQVFNKSFYISEIDDFNKDGKIDFKGKIGCDKSIIESIVTIE